MIEKGQLVDFLYHRKLPQQYVIEDTKLKYPLYKYLQSVFSGADELLQYINDILYLVDVDKVEDKYLPYFLQSFGFKYFEDIDPKYQRKILANIGILRKRRGTSNLVRFIVRVLADMDVEVEYNPDTRILTLTLKAESINDIMNMATSRKVITRYIQDFIPYYCKVEYEAETVPAEIKLKQRYSASAVFYQATYNVIPEKYLEVVN